MAHPRHSGVRQLLFRVPTHTSTATRFREPQVEVEGLRLTASLRPCPRSMWNAWTRAYHHQCLRHCCYCYSCTRQRNPMMRRPRRPPHADWLLHASPTPLPVARLAPTCAQLHAAARAAKNALCRASHGSMEYTDASTAPRSRHRKLMSH